eukprot:TRINITY_DN4213_c0_g1_i1.p1 TRINITY_DN4213_c0_g1~~TRINITY_DN4213_c0_g1_i1.p1  ORF type:complete len:177 (+),score=32.87 TRINITY_DN4213_c0_g1_i1:137-667(+)
MRPATQKPTTRLFAQTPVQSSAILHPSAAASAASQRSSPAANCASASGRLPAQAAAAASALALGRARRAGSRAFRHWTVSAFPPSVSEALQVPPEYVGGRLLLRKVSTWLKSIPGRVKMKFARQQSIAANALRLGDSSGRRAVEKTPKSAAQQAELTAEQATQRAKKTLIAIGMKV